MRNPVVGEDYLIDYYSVLGIERDASQEIIKQQFRAKQMQYHPDRFQGLAPELLKHAERKVELLNEANEILSDPDNRAAYDAVLGGWKKAISKDGTPIIDLNAEGFSFAALLDNVGADPEASEKEAEELSLQFSGFNKATYDMICKMAESPEGLSPEMNAAYKEQLEKRDLYLSLREGFLWQSIGVQNHAPLPKLGYVAQTDEQLSDVRAEASSTLERQSLLLASGERSLLLAAPANIESTGSSGAIEHYRAKIDGHFDRQSALIMPLAQEREQVLDARFRLEAEMAYHPESVACTEKLQIEIKTGTKSHWCSFILDPDTNSARGIEEIEEFLSDPEVQSDRIGAGYSILSFKAVPGIDPQSQLEYVILKHMERLKEERKTALGQ